MKIKITDAAALKKAFPQCFKQVTVDKPDYTVIRALLKGKIQLPGVEAAEDGAPEQQAAAQNHQAEQSAAPESEEAAISAFYQSLRK